MYWLMTFLFWEYFADYLSMKAIITTLAFPEAPFYPRDHFTYYALSYAIGKVLTRSHLLVLFITCSGMVRHVQIHKTWILSIFGLVLMFFFVFAAWYRVFSNVEMILALCFVMGVCTGCIYTYTPLIVADKSQDCAEREFAQGVLTMGDTAGRWAAGLLGLFVEPYFKQHCLFELKLGDYCLTRFPKISGWATNDRC